MGKEEDLIRERALYKHMMIYVFGRTPQRTMGWVTGTPNPNRLTSFLLAQGTLAQ